MSFLVFLQWTKKDLLTQEHGLGPVVSDRPEEVSNQVAVDECHVVWQGDALHGAEEKPELLAEHSGLGNIGRHLQVSLLKPLEFPFEGASVSCYSFFSLTTIRLVSLNTSCLLSH